MTSKITISLNSDKVSPHIRESTEIHLIEDDELQPADLHKVISEYGFQVRSFKKISELREYYLNTDAQVPAALVIDNSHLDEQLPEDELLQNLGLGNEKSIPVVTVSLMDDLESRLAAYRSGSSHYLHKPVNDAHLLDILDRLTGCKPQQPYRVLLVDDDPVLLSIYEAVLCESDMIVETLSNPLETLKVIDKFEPDVIILDVYMPDVTGPELAAVLREREAQVNIPILFLSSESDMTQQLLALDLGGDDFLMKPVQHDHLVAAVSARARRARQNSAVRVRLQKTIYEYERQQHALNHHAIVSIADKAGNITYANDKFCEISGYSWDELAGKNHRIIKSDVHQDSFYHDLWKTITNGDVWKDEVCNRRKNGELYWVESTITPFLNEKGEPYQYVSIRTDITNIKEKELELEHANNLIDRTNEIARIGSWEYDIASEQLGWSKVTREIHEVDMDFQPDTETAINFYSTAEHQDRVRQLFQEAIEKGRHFDEVLQIVTAKNKQRWVRVIGVPVMEDGICQRVYGLFQDINEKEEIETALKMSQKKLKEFYDLSPLGIALTDMSGRFIEVNQAFTKITGYNEKELKALDYWELTPKEYELEEQVQLKSLREIGRFGPYEKEYRKKNGHLIPIRLNGILASDNGNQSNIWSIVEDITENKRYEQALVATCEEAERANRAKSDFLSNMSHELRTPMNAILGFTQLLQMYGGLSVEQTDNIKEILKAGNHLLKLINEVLDLSKIESGHIDMSLEPVEVCAVIEESLSLIRPLAEKRNIRLNHSGFVGRIVRADLTRFKQVMVNLLSNAIKYNRDNGSINMYCTVQDFNLLRIYVADTGIGIAAEHMGDLFKPFNRLDNEKSGAEGTGIGLTITHRIIELMGGKVGVESILGTGSTFWIELPLEAIDNTANELLVENLGARDRNKQIPFIAKYKVLYIEDNPANIRLVAQILGRRHQIHLLTTHNPLFGIELAKEHKPNLILLDINLPEINGYEVLNLLNRDPVLKDIPVVAITANAMTGDIERGLMAGFREYLTKPLDVVKFNEIVNEMLKLD